MSLPPPDSGIDWNKYKITTPSFELTPVEKPDMSPFLIHMTGKNQINSILKGEGAPRELPDGRGFLKACVPESASGGFDAKVVCFTESPTFAIDFFRFRRPYRWLNDHRFGIGFDKATLVSHGVRPVIYAEKKLKDSIIRLYNKAIKSGSVLMNDNGDNELLIDLLKISYPLLFPLLENYEEQGFMWEREWRHPSPDGYGFSFSHQDIKIICCPEEEETGIREILGEVSSQINFIRVWQEYDDVTNYLRRQQTQWGSRREKMEKTQDSDDKSRQLSSLIQDYENTLKNVESYKTLVSQLSNRIDGLSKNMEELMIEKESLETQLKKLEDERKDIEGKAQN